MYAIVKGTLLTFVAIGAGAVIEPSHAQTQQCINQFHKTIYRQPLQVTASGGVVMPPPVDLRQPNCQGTVHIVWMLPSPWTFHAGAVAIQADPRQNFSDSYPGDENSSTAHHPTSSPNYHVRDKNSDQLMHEYDLFLINSETKTSIHLDPQILNLGSSLGH